MNRLLKPLNCLSESKRFLQKNNNFIKIVEVGPRDGLQNEAIKVPTDVKIDFINRLSNTGLQSIEVTSFVSPKWVPQMCDNAQVFKGIEKRQNISYPVLIPNVKGLEAALAAGVKEIAVFTSASESFSKKNINCSIEESVVKIKEVIDIAKEKDLKIRGYVSCIVGCPYEGYIKPRIVAKVTEALFNLGCYEVSLGDTIGVGTRRVMIDLLKSILLIVEPERLAIHCHDTYGQALLNIFIALEHGIRVIDSSVSGLGGCPYAKGASGNVATEDLIYMLHGMGLQTGIQLEEIVKIGHFISEIIKKPTASKANMALYKKYAL